MADKTLVDVPKQERVSDAEVEEFRLRRFHEKEFISSLSGLVSTYGIKLGPVHPMIQSMNRFLRSRR